MIHRMPEEYVCVLLKNTLKKLTIPSKWWQKRNNIRTVRYGVRPCQLQKIFYGPVRSEIADFNLHETPDHLFSYAERNCYSSYVLNIFGTYFFYNFDLSIRDLDIRSENVYKCFADNEAQAMKYLTCRRQLTPVNYDLDEETRNQTKNRLVSPRLAPSTRKKKIIKKKISKNANQSKIVPKPCKPFFIAINFHIYIHRDNSILCSRQS